jgi:3'-phosphoadenosine 5'-phosphosulfate sulfotransferase (PAPS reductase)/FAD synthetase
MVLHLRCGDLNHPRANGRTYARARARGFRKTLRLSESHREVRKILEALAVMDGRTVCWFSCGAASAVATRLALRDNPAAVVAYCETGSEHPDNERFLSDCSRWFNAPVERLKSVRYSDTWDVWHKRRYLAGVEGALCTVELKVIPRLEWQRPTDVHVFGYTANGPDVARARRMVETYPELTLVFPLIDQGITKEACLSMVQHAGIALPPLYGLGFQNNNCLPCVKATSPDYWSLVRKTFPDKFKRMALLSRELDVRLCRINGERSFIDEIPADWPTTNPIVPACDFLCHIAEGRL